MSNTAAAYETALKSILAVEKTVHDAFVAEVSPALAAAGGRIAGHFPASTRSCCGGTTYSRSFHAVSVHNGKVSLEYAPHNANPGGTPDFYSLESIPLREFPELTAAVLRAAAAKLAA